MQLKIAVTCCAECGAAYDVDELRALELVESYGKEAKSVNAPRDAKPVAMHFEVRRCGACGQNFSTRVDGLDDMDLHMPANRYVELFGQDRVAHRIPAPGWLQVWGPTLTLLALCVGALLVATVGVVAILSWLP